jgi:hypothetical protein
MGVSGTGAHQQRAPTHMWGQSMCEQSGLSPQLHAVRPARDTTNPLQQDDPFPREAVRHDRHCGVGRGEIGDIVKVHDSLKDVTVLNSMSIPPSLSLSLSTVSIE